MKGLPLVGRKAQEAEEGVGAEEEGREGGEGGEGGKEGEAGEVEGAPEAAPQEEKAGQVRGGARV